MRKQSILLLVLCILMTGCMGNTDHLETTGMKPIVSESRQSFDAQNKYRGVAPRSFSFQETEDFFCGSTGSASAESVNVSSPSGNLAKCSSYPGFFQMKPSGVLWVIKYGVSTVISRSSKAAHVCAGESK